VDIRNMLSHLLVINQFMPVINFLILNFLIKALLYLNMLQID
jgi:hypothetical protein